MTIALSNESPIRWNDRLYDDLTALKGIGPVRQQWLREALNVRTFRDLAALTLDEIEQKFRATGKIIVRGKIDQWIREAKQRATSIQRDPELSKQPIISTVQTVNTATNDPTGADSWKPFASFVVEYQTRSPAGGRQTQRTKVHHIESDTCATWPGIEATQLCQWMREQLR
jgi:hypothetical protein